MEPDGSLPQSPEPTTGSYPEPVESSPHHHTLRLWTPFSIILLRVGLPSSLSTSRFQPKIMHAGLTSMHVTCPAHVILVDFVDCCRANQSTVWAAGIAPSRATNSINRSRMWQTNDRDSNLISHGYQTRVPYVWEEFCVWWWKSIARSAHEETRNAHTILPTKPLGNLPIGTLRKSLM
jgi:hypothetical protein